MLNNGIVLLLIMLVVVGRDELGVSIRIQSHYSGGKERERLDQVVVVVVSNTGTDKGGTTSNRV